MKKDRIFWLKAIAVVFSIILAVNSFAGPHTKNISSLPKAHLFVKNSGQVVDQTGAPRPDVQYIYSSPGFKTILKEHSFSYEFYTVEKRERNFPFLFKSGKKVAPLQAVVNTHRVDIELLNSNPHPVILPVDGNSELSYYYTGKAKGAAAPSYDRVIYKDIYPSIDFVFHAGPNNVKYDIVLRPSARLSDVQLLFKGMDDLRLENGKLLLQTSQGSLQEVIPSSFVEGSAQPLKIQYNLNDNILSFSGNYPENSSVIIDPSLTWATYFGGSDEDDGYAAVTDASGNIYLTGATLSTSGIATTGAFKTTMTSGSYDAFIVKLNSSGARQWATYFGGSADDWASGIAMDGSGKIVIGGFTSSDSIATAGAYKTTLPSVNGSGFFARFTSAGSLSYSTYYGGSLGDFAVGLTADASGNVYLTGGSFSPNGIATGGAYQTSNGGGGDAFLAKFSSSGALSWGTYYGGSGQDIGLVVSLDKSGNIILAGITASSNNISSSGAFQASQAGGNDGFVAKFNSSGSRLWATYYGASGDEVLEGITTDANANIYVSGNTTSITGLSSSGSHQSANAGGMDGIIVRFSANGARNWATFFGGTGDDDILQIGIDATGGYLFLAGNTSSTSGIATSGAYQGSNAGGSHDVFIAQFSISGLRIYSTYYGGADDDSPYGISVDGSNYVYCAGYTSSTSGIATSGVYQTSYGGGSSDAFLAKFYFAIPDVAVTNLSLSTTTACANSALSAKVALNNVGKINDSNIIVYLRFVGVNTYTFTDTLKHKILPTGKDTAYFSNLKVPAEGNYTVYAFKSGYIAHDTSAKISVTMSSLPRPDFQAANECYGTPVSFSNSSAITTGSIASYSWKFGDGGTSSLSAPTHSYTKSGTYTIVLSATSDKGCIDSIKKQVTVNAMPVVSFNAPSSACLKSRISFVNNTTLASGSVKNWKWKFGDGSTSTLKSPSHTYNVGGTFTIVLIATSDSGCVDSSKSTISVAAQSLAASFTSGTVCKDSATTFTDASIGTVTSWTWNFGDGNSSTLQNPTHTYAAAGDYTAWLKVKNGSGCVDSVSNTVTVYSAPSAKFSYRDSCNGKTVVLMDSSSDFSTFMTDWMWDYGDGNTENKQFPSPHSYTGPGTYTVKLKVRNLHGCTDEISKSVTVNPTADAGFTATMADSMGNFNFAATQSGLSSYAWKFGDGDSSNAGANVSHLYKDSGTYTVSLCATASGGCSACHTESIHVYKVNGISAFEPALFQYRLEPNPFSGSFNLSYTLTKLSKVRISIADLQGREISVITDGIQPQGSYYKNIQPAISSGIYILQMSVNGQLMNQRIVKIND